MLRRLHVLLIEPEDVIPHLAKQELHLKSGYSAKELALSWANGSNDFPKAVRRALRTAPEYAEAELIDEFFELEVELRSAGRKRPVLLSITHNSGPVSLRFGLKFVTINLGTSLLDCWHGVCR